MTNRITFCYLACLILFSGTAIAGEPTLRFTTENVAPGKPVSIDLDITGATKIVLEVTAAGTGARIFDAQLEGSAYEAPFSDLGSKGDGKKRLTTLKRVSSKGKLSPSKSDAADFHSTGTFRIAFPVKSTGTSRFTATADPGKALEKGDPQPRIRILHDAPPPKPFTTGPPAKEIAKLRGNPRNGRGLLGRGTCLSCHVFNGRGGDVGPELTKIGSRLDFPALVEAIADPSAVLSQGYESIILETTDSTPHLGFITDEDKNTVTIRDTAAQSHEIEKKEIVSRKQHPYSLMPPFADILTPQQIADLASYLASLKE